MQKGQTQVLILAGIVILIAVAGGIFFLGRVTAPKPQLPVATSSPQPSPTPDETVYTESDETTNWKTYTNTNYGFSVKYPTDLEVEDRSNQFPPFTIFLTDKTKQVPYEGGSKINPYALIEVKNSNLSLMDYINDSKNNLEYVDKKKVGENEFVIAREKFGMIAGQFNRYLIKNGNSVITAANSLYAIDGQTFDQLLSTFRFLP